MRPRPHALLLLLLAACSESPSGPPNGPVGSFKVTATTTGAGAKPTLLQLLVDDDDAVIIDANGSHVFENVSVGELVARVVVPSHCGADHHAPRSVEIIEGEVTELSWSVHCPIPIPAGIIAARRLDLSNTPSTLWRANLDGTGAAPVGGEPGLAGGLFALNPARTRVAYTGVNTLAISHVDRSATILATLGSVASVEWSPDGARLLVATSTGDVVRSGTLSIVWPDGKIMHTIRTLNGTMIVGARWAPDGIHIAYRAGSYIFVENLVTGARQNTGHILVGASELAWSPDGTELAFLADGRIEVMRTDGSGRRILPGSYPDVHEDLDWGSNGLLLVGGYDQAGFHRFPHTIPATGGPWTPLFDDGGWYYGMRWAP
jgi:WD40 repeat protein